MLPLDKVLQGNCLDILHSLPNKSIDTVFAGPPYNLQLQQQLWRPNNSQVSSVTSAWDQFSDLAEYDEFTQAWLEGCRRLLKDTGTIWVTGSYHNIYRVGKILQDLGFWILNDIVWVKTQPMPNFRGVRFTNAHETLIWAQKDKGQPYPFNYRGMKSLNDDVQMRSNWTLPTCRGRERIKIDGIKAHPAQKPKALLYRVLLASTNPGDVVLDPFFGTGTTGAVAKKLHRHWIGIGIDPNFAELARERIVLVQPTPYSERVFSINTRKKRIPFGTLLETGLLQPGQLLFLEKNTSIAAVIVADGKVSLNGTTGSIHQVAKTLLGPAVNGWKTWYFIDGTGELQSINNLRAHLEERWTCKNQPAGHPQLPIQKG